VGLVVGNVRNHSEDVVFDAPQLDFAGFDRVVEEHSGSLMYSQFDDVAPQLCLLVLSMGWGKILIYLSAPTRLWYKLRLMTGLLDKLGSNRLVSNRSIYYRLIADRLFPYRLLAYRLVSLGGYISVNRLCGIFPRLWSDWG